MSRLALRGDLLDLDADPGLDDASGPGARFRPDHWLLIEDGRIVAVQPQAPGEDWPREDHRGRLILPGFIDTHVHSGQIDVIGAYGTALLDWLEKHTFPAERRMADADHAQRISALFLDALLATGTTSASVFPTVHATSVNALFEQAQARGMRLIAGKVLMDRHAPDFLRDDVVQAELDSRALIERWHGNGRLAYAVTPRFAPTSSDAQLAMAGRLLASTPGLYMQTHVAENQDEVRWVAELFPQARSYLDVYAQHGLLTERAIFAHGIWLDDADRAALRASGAQLSHCPSSNLFLGSGLFDWAAAQAAGIPVSLGCDVGGGTSLSMLRTMADAYKVQAMAGRRLTAWKTLYAATLGAARALRLDHEIGSLAVGTLADVAVWDWAVGPVAARRHEVARDVHDRLFAWMTLGDERNLVATFVAGQRRYGSTALRTP
ncbi:guanine deaminase [Ideonella sp. BN130291]|uniref:guanine deaminase n=1 Tax=Ideonella sp. BN130291 TaxID=3112940 RepID=UPI002E25CEB9|nr:guanine deaminase [Ideonella sp. BN130291]